MTEADVKVNATASSARIAVIESGDVQPSGRTLYCHLIASAKRAVESVIMRVLKGACMRFARFSLASAIAFSCAGTLITVLAQQTPCSHGPDETAAQRQRRQQALLFVRQVNTAQAAASSGNQSYRPLPQLADVPSPPDGFSAQLVVDQGGYALSVKDTQDACHFAYFSDQSGIIYTGQPIR